MRKQVFLSMIEVYRGILNNAGVEPRIVDATEHLSKSEMLGHCLFVLNEKIEPLLQRVGGAQEAIRLLGCIQGTVMACGLCTIAETRQHAADAGLRPWDQILTPE
jgi:hypothetical protein